MSHVVADDWMNLESRISALEADRAHFRAVLDRLESINNHLADIKRLLVRAFEGKG